MSASQDGVQPQCKDCRREYYATNIDAILARQRNYKISHAGVLKERAKAYRAENKNVIRAREMKRLYKITEDDLERILDSQHGRCANLDCFNTPEPGGRRFHIDHDHSCCPGVGSCGKCIRGVLCPSCNKALGLVNDNSKRLRGLADYVERNSAVRRPGASYLEQSTSAD